MWILYRCTLYPAAALLAFLLWILRWKARIVRLHLDSFRPALSRSFLLHGQLFLLSWYFNLSLDLLRFVFGRYEIPIRLRDRDVNRLEALKSSPSLFLTAHFHHWEALASWLLRNQVPVVGAARKLHHPLAHRLLVRFRKKLSVQVVDEAIHSFAQQHLRSGKCFGMLWDQYSPRSRHSSPFFGLPAAMNPLPEILVRRCRPLVWVGLLLPDGTFRLVLIMSSRAVNFSPEKLSRRYHRILEIVIRRHPTFWYGLCHARFKGILPYPGLRPRVAAIQSSLPVPADLVSRETSCPTPVPDTVAKHLL